MINPFKNRTKARLQSLEEALGLRYVHADGYNEHIVEQDGYSLVNKVLNRLKELEDGKTKKAR